ncbi:hypothetical protein EON65_24035 [archaeon]|nr:MAG: hypothetical protein EON65_24035 [archaeon]
MVKSSYSSSEMVSSPLTNGDTGITKTTVKIGKSTIVVDEEKANLNAVHQQHMKKTLIYDAIGVQFHFTVFVYQLFVHIFIFVAPFVLPNPHGQGFQLNLTPSARFNIIPPICVYLSILLYFCLSQHDQQAVDTFVYIPVLFFLAHRIILSLKYASLSETEYQRFNSCKDPAMSADYLRQMMLYSGNLHVVLHVGGNCKFMII